MLHIIGSKYYRLPVNRTATTQRASGQQQKQRYGRLIRKSQRAKGKKSENTKHLQERNATDDTQIESLAATDHSDDNWKTDDIEEYEEEEDDNAYRTAGRTGSASSR